MFQFLIKRISLENGSPVQKKLPRLSSQIYRKSLIKLFVKMTASCNQIVENHCHLTKKLEFTDFYKLLLNPDVNQDKSTPKWIWQGRRNRKSTSSAVFSNKTWLLHTKFSGNFTANSGSKTNCLFYTIDGKTSTLTLKVTMINVQLNVLLTSFTFRQNFLKKIPSLNSCLNLKDNFSLIMKSS